MINIMVKNGFLKRSINEKDRRRFILKITARGVEVIKKITPIIMDNRAKSLHGITQDELEQLTTILKKIKSNCN